MEMSTVEENNYVIAIERGAKAPSSGISAF